MRGDIPRKFLNFNVAVSFANARISRPVVIDRSERI
jgi:hypothetical protein